MFRDEIGDRMKKFYENRSQTYLTRRTPVIIRLDGKAFHTFTRNFEKPFDEFFLSCMKETALTLCEEIQGCKFGYTQSDEISLLLTDWDTLKTDSWFDYNVQKMASVSASIATAHFNAMIRQVPENYLPITSFAFFDSRVFNIPKEDVNNYFYWRELDCVRNSVLNVAQTNFSKNQMFKKSIEELIEMLEKEKGIIFDEIPDHYQRGSGFYKQRMKMQSLDGQTYYRNVWNVDKNLPYFSLEKEYIERFLR